MSALLFAVAALLGTAHAHGLGDSVGKLLGKVSEEGNFSVPTIETRGEGAYLRQDPFTGAAIDPSASSTASSQPTSESGPGWSDGVRLSSGSEEFSLSSPTVPSAYSEDPTGASTGSASSLDDPGSIDDLLDHGGGDEQDQGASGNAAAAAHRAAAAAHEAAADAHEAAGGGDATAGEAAQSASDAANSASDAANGVEGEIDGFGQYYTGPDPCDGLTGDEEQGCLEKNNVDPEGPEEGAPKQDPQTGDVIEAVNPADPQTSDEVCDGLQGQELADCEAKLGEDAGPQPENMSAPCDELEGDAKTECEEMVAITKCAGLSGEELATCMKEIDEETAAKCAGLEGEELSKCAEEVATGGDSASGASQASASYYYADGSPGL